MLVDTWWLTTGTSVAWRPMMAMKRMAWVTTKIMKTGRSAVTDSFYALDVHARRGSRGPAISTWIL